MVTVFSFNIVLMYNSESLLDIHGRAHESLRRLIAFCSTLATDALHRPLSGFGFPTILRQREHTIGDLTDALGSHTSSDRPSIIVSQALVRLKKDGHVESAGRGVYKLTTAGKKRAAED